MPRSLAYSRQALVPHLLSEERVRASPVSPARPESATIDLWKGYATPGKRSRRRHRSTTYRSPSGALGPRRLASRGERKRRGHDGRFATSMTRASSSSERSKGREKAHSTPTRRAERDDVTTAAHQRRPQLTSQP